MWLSLVHEAGYSSGAEAPTGFVRLQYPKVVIMQLSQNSGKRPLSKITFVMRPFVRRCAAALRATSGACGAIFCNGRGTLRVPFFAFVGFPSLPDCLALSPSRCGNLVDCSTALRASTSDDLGRPLLGKKESFAMGLITTAAVRAP